MPQKQQTILILLVWMLRLVLVKSFQNTSDVSSHVHVVI